MERVKLRPIVNYPAKATCGERYRMSVNLELVSPEGWPYPKDQYEIQMIFNLSPYFKYSLDDWYSRNDMEPKAWFRHRCQYMQSGEMLLPVDRLFLHRCGKTFGGCVFLLETSTQPLSEGPISITFTNADLLPIAYLELPCEVVV